MTTTTVSLTTAIVTSIATLIPLLIAAWLRLREVLAPLLRRRLCEVRVLCTEAGRVPAGAFVARLQQSGYQRAVLTQSPAACAGAAVAVIWHPGTEMAAQAVAAVRAAAPLSVVLVLTHLRLTIDLGESVLLSNSEIRLRADIGTIAESLK